MIKRWTGSFSAEAWDRLGESLYNQDKKTESLTPYIAVLGKYKSRVEFSIPAASRSASIQKSLGKNAEAYLLAHRSGLEFANYLNDRRFAQEVAKLKSIYYEFSDEYGDEKDVNPYPTD